MPPSARDGLVHSIDELHLLNPSQRADFQRDVLPHFPEPKALAAEVLRRGWLSPYQANLLLQGRATELVLGAYLLEERLGEGGTGQVFKARHRHMNRVVALKVIRSELMTDPAVVARFYREIQVISKLDHPHIVHAFDAGPVGTNHMLIMEYIAGVDLARLIKQMGRLPIALACDYVRQSALGLQHAHEKGLIHRDVKPSNLFLARGPNRDTRVIGADQLATSAQGTVKILDLGLARLQTKADGDRTAPLTRVGADMMGTPDYLAPEQALDFHGVDIRADIYSLGCTLFFLLTGQPPFPGGSLAQKVMRHQQAPPPAVESLRPDVPRALSAAIRRMLAKRPEDRFSSPAEVAAAMGRLSGPNDERTMVIGSVPATFPSTDTVPDAPLSPTLRQLLPSPRKSRLTLALAAGGAAMVLLVAALVVGSLGRSGGGEKTIPPIVARVGTTHSERLETKLITRESTKPQPTLIGNVRLLDDLQNEELNWFPWSSVPKYPVTRTWTAPGKVGKRASLFEFAESSEHRVAGMNFEVPSALRDWSQYRELHFWFRGNGSGQTLGIGLDGHDRQWDLRDDKADWREIHAPFSELHGKNGEKGVKPEELRNIFRVSFVLWTNGKGSFQFDQLELLEK